MYERRNFTTVGAPPGPPRLWWVTAGTGDTAPLFSNTQYLGINARFSPDGEWVSYNAPQSRQVEAYNLHTAQNIAFPSQTGESASWSPDGDQLLLTEIDLSDGSFQVHIFLADLGDGGMNNLSGEGEINDGMPAFSPNGKWIIFHRKSSDANEGKQLWLLSADSTIARQLTDEPDINHTLFAWSPDSQQIVVQRFALTTPGTPTISVLELATGTFQQVASPGIEPAWLP